MWGIGTFRGCGSTRRVLERYIILNQEKGINMILKAGTVIKIDDADYTLDYDTEMLDGFPEPKKTIEIILPKGKVGGIK